MFLSAICQLEQLEWQETTVEEGVGDNTLAVKWDLPNAWPYWVKYAALVIKNKTELVNIQAKLRVLEKIAEYTLTVVWIVGWLVKKRATDTRCTNNTPLDLQYMGGKNFKWTFFFQLCCEGQILDLKKTNPIYQ